MRARFDRAPPFQPDRRDGRYTRWFALNDDDRGLEKHRVMVAHRLYQHLRSEAFRN